MTSRRVAMPCVFPPPALLAQTPAKHPALRLRGGRRTPLRSRSVSCTPPLRPIFHHKTDRVSGHLFISVLAYHLVHTIRFQLKAAGIHLSWEGIRRALAGQDRVTVTLKRADGKTIHIRKATRAEPRQQAIYDALGIGDQPGRTEKTVA